MTQSSSAGTKRSRSATAAEDNRAEVHRAEDNRAECPFSVRIVSPREPKTKSKKRRKRGHSRSGTADHADDDDTATRKILNQCAPFEPKGTFDTHSTMDVHYVVEPAKQWAEMTRYNSFVLNNLKYYCEGFIYVANESSIERQKGTTALSAPAAAPSSASPDPDSTTAPSVAKGGGVAGGSQSGPAAVTGRESRKRSEDDWVARILEIRASDEHHVYARVFWMYWPDELPTGTHYGKRQVHGRQSYHGAAELIASNHMDIINVVSVTSMATVNQLIEDRDDDVQSALYWRQALDVRNMELSSIENVCDCNKPANPDKMLVGCGDESCGKWIHEECLKHYALMRVYERLGRDKPHLAGKEEEDDGTAYDATKSVKESIEAKEASEDRVDGPLKIEASIEDVKEPLSPHESGGAVSAQHSIDVKPNDDAADKESSAEGEVSSATTPVKDTVVAVRGRKSATATPVGGKPRKMPTLHSFGGKSKPYDKLYEATLLLTPLESTAAPTMIEITDLRGNVAGGVKRWLEPAECPACGSAIR